MSGSCARHVSFPRERTDRSGYADCDWTVLPNRPIDSSAPDAMNSVDADSDHDKLGKSQRARRPENEVQIRIRRDFLYPLLAFWTLVPCVWPALLLGNRNLPHYRGSTRQDDLTLWQRTAS